MEAILQKLNATENSEHMWYSWKLEEMRELLEIYLIIVKKEQRILELIGKPREDGLIQECEDRFFHEKIVGIEETVDILTSEIDEKTD